MKQLAPGPKAGREGAALGLTEVCLSPGLICPNHSPILPPMAQGVTLAFPYHPSINQHLL